MNNQDLRFVTNVDAQAQITYINEDYQNWIGFSNEAVVGEPTSILRAPDSPPIIQQTIANECRNNRTVHFVVHEKKRNGETFWVDMTIQPIFEQGQYQGYTSVKKLIESPQKIAQAKQLFADLKAGKKIYYNGQWVDKTKHRLFAMVGLHRATLSQKIMTALLIIGLLILGIAFAVEQNQKAQIESEAAVNHSKLLSTHLDKLMAKKGEMGLTNATGLTFSPEIRQAAADQDQARLAQLLANIGEHYRGLTDLRNVKLHFSDEQLRSYFKSWKPLDKQVVADFSNRGYLPTMQQAQKPMVSYAVSSAGFNIKSLVPIIKNGRFEGAVEFIQGLGSVRRDFASQNQHYLLAVSRDYAMAGDQFRQKNADNLPISNDKQWVVGHNQQFSMEHAGDQIKALRQVDLNKLFEQGFLITDQHFHYAQPVFDHGENRIGYHIISEDVNDFMQIVQQQFAVAENTFYGILISIIALMGLFAVLLWFQVINPIKKTQGTMEKAVERSDLFARIHTYGNDEIHQMAQAYNRQSMMTQVVISEVNTAMNEIVAGRLDHSIDFPFEADYGLLQDRINQASESLKTTFSTIGSVMDDLRHGHFDKAHPNTLRGAYATVVDDCNETMKTLSEVFKEINQVMDYASRGKFDERIQTLSQGNIRTLQETINQSLEILEAGFKDVVQAAERMAKGDFSQPITRDYEYTMDDAKQAINQSLEGLTHALTQVMQTTHEVNDGAQTVADGTQDLNERTQQQAASLEQTSSAMEETTSQIRSNLENTDDARKIAESQSSLLTRANEVMQNTKASMSDIQTASGQIKEITTMIDSIAFQTNLLALNAAVEAARAGEHGRGFAVVAGEVRSLAGKSADAAKEIGTLVEQTASAINTGVTHVEEVGNSLGEVTEETQKMLDIVREVSRASEEQSHGVDEVNKAITQIDGSTQQNAALVEETTATTESMMKSAQSLQAAVSAFKLKKG